MYEQQWEYNNDIPNNTIANNIHNNNKGFLFGTFDEVHYGDDVIEEKDNENNNESTTVDNNVCITTSVCSDTIDVYIHNNKDEFYFGTFDDIHYNNDDNNIVNPCHVCAAPGIFSISIKLEEKIDNLNQNLNQEGWNCSFVIPSSKNHTNCFGNDEFDTYGPSNASDIINNKENDKFDNNNC